LVLSGRFLKEVEARVVHALAATAAAISTLALLVMLSLTAFVVSLALRAHWTRARRTTDLETSIADDLQADPPSQRLNG
jgi:hypothetical protein